MFATSAIADKSDVLVSLAGDLGDFALRSAREGATLDQVERDVFGRVLAIGFAAVKLFLDAQGNGDLGPSIRVEDGRTLYRSQTIQQRPLRTIFGEHTLTSYVYAAAGRHRKIELRPIDARLNLPAGKASYLLEEFTQLFCVEKAFAVGAQQFEAVFRQRLSVDVLEDINHGMGEQAERFLDALPAPSPAEEGTILVSTSDGKGVPLVKEDAAKVPVFDRREKPGNRRMATLGCVYTVAPHVRTPEQIVAALFRDPTVAQPSSKRPEACHKRYRAYFAETGPPGEDPIPGAFRTWTWLSEEVSARYRQGQTLVRLMDGQSSLWTAADACLEAFIAQRQAMETFTVIDILDILHVSTYVWKAAKAFHAHREHQEAFAQDRLLRILHGDVSGVVTGLRRMATQHQLKGSKLADVTTTCNYFANNAHRMRYDVYLRAGYPIASGVIEGACRHVIKDRMEHGGMRWRLKGAQAMLHVRCVCASSEWKQFCMWRQAEQAHHVHPFRAAVADYKGFSA